MPRTVDVSQIAALRKEPAKPKNPSSALTWVDEQLRCASRGCSSPTYCKVESIPYCMKHGLDKLDELIVKLRGGTDEDLKAEELV